MALPDVKIKLSNGNLGRIAPSEDGTSGLIVSGAGIKGKFEQGTVLGPFVSELDAQAKGINEAYDAENSTLAYKHILDFYTEAGRGTKLYVMVVDKVLLMTDILDNNQLYAKKMLAQAGGAIKLLGVTRVPNEGYKSIYNGEFDEDVFNAIEESQRLINNENSYHRPLRILIEGRDWKGDVSATTDLRNVGTSPNANGVCVVIGNDNNYAKSAPHALNYAALGAVLGRAAFIPVQRNIGRVKDGAIKIAKAGFSNGYAYNTIDDNNLQVLNDKGYVFFKTHAQKAGFFINDDHTACPITDDYAQLSLGRVIDKVARITRRVYVEEILDEIEIDPTTGKIATATMKHYEGIIEEAINVEMTTKGEISKIDAYIDPNQNVLATSKIAIIESVTPKGTARIIEATLAYANPSTN